MTNNFVIEIKNLSFSYGGYLALDNVNIAIPEKNFVTIIGPNGGGKTTLLKLLLGFLKPDHGKLIVLGKTPAAARSSIGYVPQHFQFDPQFPITVSDLVLMGKLPRGYQFGFPKKKELNDVKNALKKVGLDSFSNRAFPDLSGGQRQRALIARAIVSHPQLLFLDEPTAHVDVVAIKELSSLLKELTEKMTVLMVSHDVGFVSNFCDQILCINKTARDHPKKDLSDALMSDLYGTNVQMVRHDLNCGMGEEK